MSPPEVNRLPEVIEAIEWTEEQDKAWEWYLRLGSIRKVTAQMCADYGRHFAVSTIGHWIKQRSAHEQSAQAVMHLFNRAEQQLLVGHALKLMFGDAQAAVIKDGSRLEKLGPYMLGIIDRYCRLLGLNSPERVSIEDDRRNTVRADYGYLKALERQLDQANDVELARLETEQD